jgi:hypothetical protein
MAAREDHHAFCHRIVGYFSGEDSIDKVEKYVENYELKTLSKFVKTKSRNFEKSGKINI